MGAVSKLEPVELVPILKLDDERMSPCINLQFPNVVLVCEYIRVKTHEYNHELESIYTDMFNSALQMEGIINEFKFKLRIELYSSII